MLTTPRGAPYPEASDANDYPGRLHDLATWVNDRPGIATLTTTQRNALAGADLWTGRHIWNSTTLRLEYYDGTRWGPTPCPGRILAQTVTITGGSATGSTSDADVDATNYAVTFTVPASGNVWVEVESYIAAGAATGATTLYWTLRNGTTVVGTALVAQASAAADLGHRARAAFYLTGLTAGASVTLKLGHHIGGSNTVPTSSTTASSVSPASMRVVEA